MGRPPPPLKAIAWKYRTGSPWRDLPDELGSLQIAHKRLIRWAMDGTWERMLAAVLALADADDDIDWTVSVDSTVVRALQHAAGALNKGHQPQQGPLTMHSELARRAQYEGPSGPGRPCTALGPHPHRGPGR